MNIIVGLMLVGWGGNNGSTLTAGLIANKKGLKWQTKNGEQSANFFGSIMMSSTTRIGIDNDGEDVFIPFKDLIPIVNPNDLGK